MESQLQSLARDPILHEKKVPKWSSTAQPSAQPCARPGSPGARASLACRDTRSSPASRAIAARAKGRPRADGGAAGGPARGSRRRRPQSAPTLLRGDGLIACRAYEDPLRQRIEDMEVHRLVDRMRRECHVQRDVIDAVDVLSDQTLFDLKVLHNSCQRARSAAAGARPSSAGAAMQSGPSQRPRHRAVGPQVETGPAQQLHDLCGLLDRDTRGHCSRLKVPHKCVQEPRLRKMLAKMQDHAMIGVVPLDIAVETGPTASGKDDKLGLGLKFKFKSPETDPGLDADAPSDAAVLARLVRFLEEGIGLTATLEAMDGDGRGWLTREDWDHGLELLGFGSGAKAAFVLLDTEEHGELTIKQLVERLRGLARTRTGSESGPALRPPSPEGRRREVALGPGHH